MLLGTQGLLHLLKRTDLTFDIPFHALHSLLGTQEFIFKRLHRMGWYGIKLRGRGDWAGMSLDTYLILQKDDVLARSMFCATTRQLYSKTGIWYPFEIAHRGKALHVAVYVKYPVLTQCDIGEWMKPKPMPWRR